MINLKIARVDEIVYDGQCSQVTVKTAAGVVSLLPRHAPFVSIINSGYVRIKDGLEMDINSGYISVSEDSKVNILVMN